MARNACIANGTYRWIGGTDSFNYAVGTALQELGYTVYYYAPDMDGTGVTERHLRGRGIVPYGGQPLDFCIANQQSGAHFVGRCPVLQVVHSAYTMLEYPVKGATVYSAVSEEIRDYLDGKGFHGIPVVLNGIDLVRFRPTGGLREVPQVLSICQGDDVMLSRACSSLGYRFRSVPKSVDARIWDIENLIGDADIVVGIGRSLYDAMACGRACISWDNRGLNPYSGCGYVTADSWYAFAHTNFTGRGYPQIRTIDGLVRELRKYRPSDGGVMRGFAERELDVRKNVARYLSMLGIVAGG